MAKLQTALTAEEGQAKLAELRSISDQAASTASAVAQLGIRYQAFRAGLGGDAEDESFADASFGIAIARDKATIDSLSAADRAWVDAYIQGLGYTKV